uniref:Uncharacterized protein n=1 Tax=Strigamia maritima TaxID=126957 RepID=T1JC59_STRMM
MGHNQIFGWQRTLQLFSIYLQGFPALLISFPLLGNGDTSAWGQLPSSGGFENHRSKQSNRHNLMASFVTSKGAVTSTSSGRNWIDSSDEEHISDLEVSQDALLNLVTPEKTDVNEVFDISNSPIKSHSKKDMQNYDKTTILPLLLHCKRECVDISENEKDVLADNAGKWLQTGTEKKQYKLLNRESDNNGILVIRHPKGEYEIIRRTYKNGSDATFRKTHASLKIKGSTKCKLQVGHGTAKRILFNVSKEVGGIDADPSKLPRNRNQVIYEKTKYQAKSSLDPLLIVSQLMQGRLMRKQPALTNLYAYGTDGEQALINALGFVFKNSIPLLCSIHQRHNITDKPRELGIPQAETIWQNKKQSKIDKIVDDLHDFVQANQREIEKAVFNLSDCYEINSEFSHLKCRKQCAKLSADEHRKYVKQFNECKVTEQHFTVKNKLTYLKKKTNTLLSENKVTNGFTEGEYLAASSLNIRPNVITYYVTNDARNLTNTMNKYLVNSGKKGCSGIKVYKDSKSKGISEDTGIEDTTTRLLTGNATLRKIRPHSLTSMAFTCLCI